MPKHCAKKKYPIYECSKVTSDGKGQPISNCDNVNAEIPVEDLYCFVCEKVIMQQEGDLDNFGGNAVFCEGTYQCWFHRICVGLIKKLYIALGGSDGPYLCPYYMTCKHNTELINLTNMVKTLSEELSKLKSIVDSLKETIKWQQSKTAALQSQLSAVICQFEHG